MSKIGLLVDQLSHPYQNELLLGAHEESFRSDVSLYCIAGGEIDIHHKRNSIYDLVSSGSMDGIIVSSGTMARSPTSAELSKFVRRFGPIPITSVSIELENIPSVVVDNTAGIRELTQHLIDEHGRRRIAFIRVANPEGEQRFAGYQAALASRGLPLDPDLIVLGDFTWESGVRAVETLFDGRKTACDAIVASSDWIAIGALDALRRRGISVPEHVAITGFDDIDEARFSQPSLTTVYQPVRDLGVTALRLTLELIRTGSVPLVTRVPTGLEYRESCGCFAADLLEPLAARAPSRGGLDALELERASVASALVVRVARGGGVATSGDWPLSIVDALVRDLRRGTRDQLASALRDMFACVHHLRGFRTWRRVLSALRDQVAPYLTADSRLSRHAESLYEQADLVVATEAERVQGKLRWDREHLMNVLNEMSSELRRVFDYDAATEVLIRHMERLAVPSCYVALHTDRCSPDADAELLLAYDSSGGAGRRSERRRFRSRDLLPPGMGPKHRHTMVVEPLWFGEGSSGFCVLEMGSTSGLVYEAIREQLSSAFHAVQLLQSKVDETTKREKAERARLENEMRLAQRIQTSMLPRAGSPKGFEIASDMQPAAEVGGDYFDIVPFDGGCWLGIGDVAGHGLDTGLITLMIQGVVAGAICQRPEASPALVWRIVNWVLYDNIRQRLERDEHATLTLLRCGSDGRVRHAGAHEDLIIFRHGSGVCEVSPSSGIWVGIVPDVEEGQVEETEVGLQPGDVLLLFTDGITEAMHPEHGRFGIERLIAALNAVGHEPIEKIRAHIIDVTRRWAPDLTDDRTFVAVRYRG